MFLFFVVNFIILSNSRVTSQNYEWDNCGPISPVDIDVELLNGTWFNIENYNCVETTDKKGEKVFTSGNEVNLEVIQPQPGRYGVKFGSPAAAFSAGSYFSGRQPAELVRSKYGVFEVGVWSFFQTETEHNPFYFEGKDAYLPYKAIGYLFLIYLDSDFLVIKFCATKELISKQKPDAPVFYESHSNGWIFTRSRQNSEEKLINLDRQLKNLGAEVNFDIFCNYFAKAETDKILGKSESASVLKNLWTRELQPEEEKYLILENCLRRATNRRAFRLCFVEFNAMSS